MKDHLPTEFPEPLPRPVIDAHTHLDSVCDYTGCSPSEALEQAATVGVSRAVQIGCTVADSHWARDLARQHEAVRVAVALHPNEAARVAARGAEALSAALVEIEELVAAEPELIRAVGETGLDYYRTSDLAGQHAQRESFAAHIQIAARHHRALAIHDRDAHDDVLATLAAEGWPERVIMHCFSGDADHARACLAADSAVYLSFSGTVTYKANAYLRDALRSTPLDRIVIETDAPFLVPVPWRGWPNAPVLIPHTVRMCADLLDVDLAAFCDQITANTEAAYGGAW